MPFAIVGFLLLSACSLLEGEPPVTDSTVMERYERVKSEIEFAVHTVDGHAGIGILRNAITDDPSLTPVCHGLSHELGHAIIARYGFTEAMRYEDDVCGSGLIHGIIEEYLDEVEDLQTALNTLCEPNAAKCFHGIGHGLMFRSDNDVPGSLALCDTFSQGFQRNQCAEGVFMENFEADGKTHFSKYLREDDPYFPCRGQTAVHEGVCAFYAPRYYLHLHSEQYTETMEWCQTIPEGPRDACIKGVGDIAMKHMVESPLAVVPVCDRAPAEKRTYCIQGMVSYYIVHHASYKKGAELCPLLSEEDRSICERVVLENVRFYPD